MSFWSLTSNSGVSLWNKAGKDIFGVSTNTLETYSHSKNRKIIEQDKCFKYNFIVSIRGMVSQLVTDQFFCKPELYGIQLSSRTQNAVLLGGEVFH